jgi:2-keto-4-pentenoate hydratase/2-oxohepta-3-ene-1,7-dioic acid hydratase in catechol pathway
MTKISCGHHGLVSSRSLAVLITTQYVNHAKEVNMALPEVPTVFYKPATSLADPFPAPTVIPKAVVKDNAADYESELALVIGKEAKNVSEEEALDYLLG